MGIWWNKAMWNNDVSLLTFQNGILYFIFATQTKYPITKEAIQKTKIQDVARETKKKP